MKKIKRKTLYYSNRNTFSYDKKKYIFYIEVGSRGTGKTYSTQNYCLRQFFKYGKKTLWLRLKEPSVKKLLANDAKDFLDSKLIEKWNIDPESIKVKGDCVYIGEKEFCKIMALSTYYQAKGVALNKASLNTKKREQKDIEKMIKADTEKYSNIIVDEFNKERSEKNTFDITYAFVNTLETVCRLDLDRRVILMANTLEEASDIMATCFNFIPEEFGIYRLHKKRAIIHYMDDSEKYKKARSESMAGILAPEESTFTNKIISDIDLVYKGKIPNQTQIIRFSNTCYFTVCGSVITQQRVSESTKLMTIAMRPYLHKYPYFKERAQGIIANAQQRIYKFDKLITLKQFYKEIKLLKDQ